MAFKRTAVEVTFECPLAMIAIWHHGKSLNPEQLQCNCYYPLSIPFVEEVKWIENDLFTHKYYYYLAYSKRNTRRSIVFSSFLFCYLIYFLLFFNQMSCCQSNASVSQVGGSTRTNATSSQLIQSRGWRLTHFVWSITATWWAFRTFMKGWDKNIATKFVKYFLVISHLVNVFLCYF